MENDDSLDAMDILKAQHRNIEQLFEQIKEGNTEMKAASFRALADLLAIHATIEEKVFYPGVKMKATEPLLRESVKEHLSIKRMLAELMEADPAEETFDATIDLLEEEVHHHAKEEEEGKLFPLIRKELDTDRMEVLGGEMIALMVKLQQNGAPPRAAIPGEIDRPAPI